MANQKLIKETLSLIQLSAMEPKEKAMWMLLLSEMEEKQILKLKKSLEKETSALNDLLLKAIQSK
jgi:hypothetical protein